MDDRSSPSLESFEDYVIPRSALTFRYFTPETRVAHMQAYMYDQCHSRFGTRHTWIGHLDVDEFLEIVDKPGTSMAEFLQGYEEYGAFGVQWITHNSNGIIKPALSVRSAFTSCIYDGPTADGGVSDNRHIKSFVQTKYFSGTESPHSFFLNESMYNVGENRDRVTFAFREPITRDKIALHHYGLKSKQEYEEKIMRSNGYDDPKTWDWCEFCVLDTRLVQRRNC